MRITPKVQFSSGLVSEWGFRLLFSSVVVCWAQFRNQVKHDALSKRSNISYVYMYVNDSTLVTPVATVTLILVCCRFYEARWINMFDCPRKSFGRFGPVDRFLVCPRHPQRVVYERFNPPSKKSWSFANPRRLDRFDVVFTRCKFFSIVSGNESGLRSTFMLRSPHVNDPAYTHLVCVHSFTPEFYHRTQHKRTSIETFPGFLLCIWRDSLFPSVFRKKLTIFGHHFLSHLFQRLVSITWHSFGSIFYFKEHGIRILPPAPAHLGVLAFDFYSLLGISVMACFPVSCGFRIR